MDLTLLKTSRSLFFVRSTLRVLFITLSFAVKLHAFLVVFRVLVTRDFSVLQLSALNSAGQVSFVNSSDHFGLK